MNISLNTNQIQRQDQSHPENSPWPPAGHRSRRWPCGFLETQRTLLISPQHANNKLTKSPLRWWHRRFQWSWWSFLVGTGSRVICTVHNDSRLIKASSAATLLFSTKLCHHVVVAAVVAENAATHSRNDSKPNVLESTTYSQNISPWQSLGLSHNGLVFCKTMKVHPLAELITDHIPF